MLGLAPTHKPEIYDYFRCHCLRIVESMHFCVLECSWGNKLLKSSNSQNRAESFGFTFIIMLEVCLRKFSQSSIVIPNNLKSVTNVTLCS